MLQIETSQIKALLARLEAAEAVCNELPKLTVWGHKPVGWDWVDKVFKAWRKTAGK